MKVLFIGDVFGRPGRELLKDMLPKLKKEYSPDFIIINIENAAGGRGVTKDTAEELFALGIDAATGGNHIWEQKDHRKVLKEYPIVRPINVENKDVAGKGFLVLKKKSLSLAIISVMGIPFMDSKEMKMQSPFHSIKNLLDKEKLPKAIIIDIHAEATAEKKALLWYLNGQVSAVLGTHTHIQTADEQITDEGTAYITDVGMTGPHKSVIGMKTEGALKRFVDGINKSLVVAKEGLELNAVLIDIDSDTGRATYIQRLMIKK